MAEIVGDVLDQDHRIITVRCDDNVEREYRVGRDWTDEDTKKTVTECVERDTRAPETGRLVGEKL